MKRTINRLRSPDAGQEPITEGTVTAWLREAQAKEPWDVEGIRVAAVNLDSLRKQDQWGLRQSQKPTVAEVARADIKALRKSLKKLEQGVDKEWAEIVRLNLTGEAVNWYQTHRSNIKKMLSALVDLPPFSRLTDPREECARAAYQCFRFIVPKGKINRSPTNPAARFVNSAVRAAGFMQWEHATLEKVLLSGNMPNNITQNRE